MEKEEENLKYKALFDFYGFSFGFLKLSIFLYQNQNFSCKTPKPAQRLVLGFQFQENLHLIIAVLLRACVKG